MLRGVLITLSVVAVLLIIGSCGAPNYKPEIVSLSSTITDTGEVTLKWKAEDEDGDPLTFDLYLNESSELVKNSNEKALVLKSTTATEYSTSLKSLKGHTTYYWKVSVFDGFDEVESSLMSFTTLNNKPRITSMSPEDGAIVATEVTLRWKATDEDRDQLTYDLYLSNSSALVQTNDEGALVLKDSTLTEYSTELEVHKTYYWKLVVFDGYDTATSSIYKFFTDNPPTVTLVSPTNNATNVSKNVTLEWNMSDPDGDDVTAYLYLATNTGLLDDPVASGAMTSYSTTLQASTTYYWKVVVKDEYGVSNESGIWSFQTGE